MFAVIFEVQPKSDRWDDYLEAARILRPELERIDGFIENERFTSRRTEGRVLSLSTWRDEKALVRWRTHALHHEVQAHGRLTVFADYHIRVGEMTADTQASAGCDLQQLRFDVTEVGHAQAITIIEVDPAGPTAPGQQGFDSSAIEQAAGLVDLESYDGISTPGKVVWLASWRDDAARQSWQERCLHATPNTDLSAIRYRSVRVIRDYGMFERYEAPQYYPPLDRAASAQSKG